MSKCDEVTYFHASSFSNCRKLKKVIFPPRLNDIRTNTFNNCVSLSEITIPASVEELGSSAFTYTNLKKINIPKAVRRVDANPFVGCSQLEAITVSADNPYYDSRENCNALIETSTNRLVASCKSTKIPASVRTIGDYAFAHSEYVPVFTLSDSIVSIGEHAFEYDGFTEFVIPNSVEDIGESAFGYCANLNKINLPESLTKLNDLVFTSCASLTEVVFPSLLNDIEVKSFEKCQLNKITFTSPFIDVSNNGEDCSFWSCSLLREIVLSGAVIRLDKAAFTRNVNIERIYSYNRVPPSFLPEGKPGNLYELATFGTQTYEEATVYVPKGCLDVYKNDGNWKYFKNIVEMETSGITPITPDPQDNTIYTINGIQIPGKVENLPSGIYIVNGKRRLVTNKK